MEEKQRRQGGTAAVSQHAKESGQQQAHEGSKTQQATQRAIDERRLSYCCADGSRVCMLCTDAPALLLSVLLAVCDALPSFSSNERRGCRLAMPKRSDSSKHTRAAEHSGQPTCYCADGSRRACRVQTPRCCLGCCVRCITGVWVERTKRLLPRHAEETGQ